MPTHDVLLCHFCKQNVINDKYTRLHTLVSLCTLDNGHTLIQDTALTKKRDNTSKHTSVPCIGGA